MQIYLPIGELPVDIMVVLGLGAAVGFISGLFGVGGGFLLTPLLIFIGIPPAVAVATQGPQIAASSLTGSLLYWRKRALDFKLGTVLIIGGIIGTLFGVMFFNQMRRIGQLETVIAISYVVLLGTIGSLIFLESVQSLARARRGTVSPRKKAGRHQWYEGLPFKMRFHRSGLYISIIPLLVISVLIGFVGAFLGIGGGFILVPALIYIFRVPASVVVGTSLFQILFSMIAATILHSLSSHAVDMFLAITLIIGGVFGAQFGARTGAKLRSDIFRLLLAMLILAVGARFGSELVREPVEPFSTTATETAR